MRKCEVSLHIRKTSTAYGGELTTTHIFKTVVAAKLGPDDDDDKHIKAKALQLAENIGGEVISGPAVLRVIDSGK